MSQQDFQIAAVSLYNRHADKDDAGFEQAVAREGALPQVVRFARALRQKTNQLLDGLCSNDPEVQQKARQEYAQAIPAVRQAVDQLLSRKSWATTDPVPGGPPAGSTPPGYEILSELGRGGMGVVYKARQLGLNRLCALKMILAGAHAAETERARFLTEARAIAEVRHPGIVQIYDFGTVDEVPYFSLELCEGGSLAGRLRESPLAAREAAIVVEQVARAVQAAHQMNVIHRDLKPANVLLTTDGSPKVTDFGLAKKLDEQGQTQTGAILGTPSYLAPEQASGSKAVGPLADVYSLGAILYECLTGRPPFKAPTAYETLLQVIEQDSVPLRQFNAMVPRDLETICTTCLRKESHKRYPSAQALADDLRCFLDGRPITARPVGVVERAVKWAKRRPAAALLLAVTCLAAFTLLIVWSIYDYRLERSYREAVEARKEEETQRLLAEERERQLWRNRYPGQISFAQQHWEGADFGRVLESLKAVVPASDQEDLRGFEWYNLWHRSHRSRATLRGHGEAVRAVAFSPTGLIASAGEDGSVRLWRADLAQPVITLPGHRQGAHALAFSRDGLLATGGADGTVRLWDPTTKSQVAALEGHKGRIQAVAFTFDGKTLASGGQDAMIRLWEVKDSRLIRAFKGDSFGVNTLAFSPNGEWLASGGAEPDVKLWELATRKGTSLGGHLRQIACVAFSPDGKELASGSQDGTVILWQTGTWKLVAAGSHRDVVHGVAFAPDGKKLATASFDQTVKVWRPVGGQWRLHGVIRGHTDHVYGVAFSVDGRMLASASRDQTVRLWDATQAREYVVLEGHLSEVYAVAFSPDSGVLAVTSADPAVKLWETGAGTEVGKLEGLSTSVKAVAFTPDGRTLVTGGLDGKVRLWDSRTHKEQTTLGSHRGWVLHLAVSSDGQVLATAGLEGTVKLWDLAGRRERLTLNSDGDQVPAVAVSPDGLTVASAGHDNQVRLWDVKTGQQRRVVKGPEGGRSILCLAFSPDGGVLAAGGVAGSLWLADVTRGTRLRELRGHTGHVQTVAFSPDGKRLASGSTDQTVKLWDPAVGEERATYREHTAPIWTATFSRNGRFLASADQHGLVMIRQATAKEDVRLDE